MFEKYQSPLRIVDGNLEYDEVQEIPEHLVQMAKEYKTRIIDFLEGRSMNDLYKRDELFIKIMYFYRGILDESNDHIESWLESDKEAATLFMKLTAEYEENGWLDISEAPFNYESNKSIEFMELLYQNAVAYFKKGSES